MTTHSADRPARRGDRWVIAGLLALTFVPVAAGIYRLITLAVGVEVTPENARFVDSPAPVVLHIVAVVLFAVLGAFQFSGRLRRRRPRAHRAMGRIVAPSGIVAALTGLWMTLFYPRTEYDSDLLTAIRVVVVCAMLISLVLGFAAVRRRDFARHRAWMIRGYAIGMGAGTQVFTLLPLTLVAGTPGPLPRALLMGLGWGINVVLAEWIIRRPARRRPRPSRPSPVLPIPAAAVAR
jgi:uncharacterized membrane protein